MKKLVLLALILFMAMSFKSESGSIHESAPGETFCESWANQIESDACGYVGCNFEIWDTAHAFCMGWEIIY